MTSLSDLDTNCIVLAGGKGFRLRRSKLPASIGKTMFLNSVMSTISPIIRKIILVIGHDSTYPHLKSHPKLSIARDFYSEKGPLGGVYTGLKLSDSFYNLVVACDMPFLNPSLLCYMIEVSVGFDVTVPRDGIMVEPLHAIYSKNCLPAIERLIKQHRLALTEVFNMVKVRYIDSNEIDRFDPEHLSFFNVNTEADLMRARLIADKRRQSSE